MDYFQTGSTRLSKRERPGEFPGRVAEALTSAKTTDKKGKAFIALFWTLAGLSSTAAFRHDTLKPSSTVTNYIALNFA
jgi:hypothetical protein